jgi:hydrogenase maturation factor
VIHVGFAIGRLDETEAMRNLRFLEEAGLLASEFDPFERES